MQNKPYIDHYFIGPIAIRFDFQLPEGFLTDKDVFNSYGLEVLGGYWKHTEYHDAEEFRRQVTDRLESNDRLTMETGVNAPIKAALVTVNSNRTVPKWMKRGIVFFRDIDDLPKAWQKNVASVSGCEFGGIAWKGGKLGELLNDIDDLLCSDDFADIEDIQMSPADLKATGIKTEYIFTDRIRDAKKALSLRKGWSMNAEVTVRDGHFMFEGVKAKGVTITLHNKELISIIAATYGDATFGDFNEQ